MSVKQIVITDKFQSCLKSWPEEIQDRVIFEVMAQQSFSKSSFTKYGDWAERGLNSDSNKILMDHLVGTNCLQLSIESKGEVYVTYITEKKEFIIVFQCFKCNSGDQIALNIEESNDLLEICEENLNQVI